MQAKNLLIKIRLNYIFVKIYELVNVFVRLIYPPTRWQMPSYLEKSFWVLNLKFEIFFIW